MAIEYNATQLDALRELANIGAGQAATALSQMLAQEVTLSVPRALPLPLDEAIASAGPADQEIVGVAIPLEGDLDAIVLLLIPTDSAQTLCGLLGVEAGTEVGDSALSEIGNILGASIMHGLTGITGLELLLCPPTMRTDNLESIVASAVSEAVGEADSALVLDTSLDLAAQPCPVSFMLIPTGGSVSPLLAALGL